MDLGEFKRRAYAQSKNFSFANTVVQSVLLAIALYAAIVGAAVPHYFGLLAFLAPIINFFLKDRSRHHYGFGERARRAQLLQDGLGHTPSQAELLDLADNRAMLPPIDPKPIDSEFTSELQQGPRRLAHITEEAAYFTKSRATFAGRAYFTLMVVGLVLTVSALWLLIQDPVTQVAGTPVTGQSLAKATATLLAFFAAGTWAERWRTFESLAKAASSTFEKCDVLRRGEPTEREVLLAVAGYDIALGRASAIPTFVFWLGQEQLNTDWKALMAPTKPPSTGSGAPT